MKDDGRFARIVDVLTLVVVVVAGAVFLLRLYAHNREHEVVTIDIPKTVQVRLDDVPAIGSASAPVVVVEFSDYQCQFCWRFSRDTFPVLRERLIDSGQVWYAMVHRPLPSHPLAPELSRAAVCAGSQGLFWQAHERLFGVRGDGKDFDRSILSGIGLDESAHAQCLQDPAVKQAIERDLKIGDSFGITGTPSFVLGQRSNDGSIRWLWRIKGSYPFAVMRRLVMDAAADRVSAHR